jgi:8-oxo-dGTP pyrophosphatase MutT (NUDIX family)
MRPMSTVADALRGTLEAAIPDPELEEGVPAAVLIPVIEAPRPRVLLTKRTETVRDHKGEISFPGGVRHEEDANLLATALRETEEELGIPRGLPDVVGRLPPTHTIVTGYVIVPFVGLLRGRPPMIPSPIEIAEVLEFELGRLGLVEQEAGSRDAEGAMHAWYAYEMGGHTVWGATGRILHAFLAALRAGGWSPEEG